MEQNQQQNENAGGFTAHVPPPPSEVTVRTLESDLASMAESGGGAPKARPVKFFHKEEEEEKARKAAVVSMPGIATGAPMGTPEAAAPVVPSFLSSKTFLAISLISLLLVVFMAGYFVIFPLLNPPVPPQAPAAVPAAQTAAQALQHKSFFTQPVDGSLPLQIPSPVDGVAAESRQLSSFVNAVSGSFFEIQPQDGSGQALSATDFFSSINTNVFSAGFLDEDFEKDFTFFLYKDKAGLWPGYVFKLKSAETPLLLANDISKIESASSSLNGLFFAEPANHDAQFHDELLSGQPVRALNFYSPTSTLAYGWFFNKYLIISTSLDGIKQAVLHF